MMNKKSVLSKQNLQNLIDAFEVIVSSLDSQEVLFKVMTQACQLTESEAASIFLLNKSGSELILEVATNLSDEQKSRIRTPVGSGIVGYVAETGKLLNIPDVSQDSRFYKKIDELTGIKTKSCLTVPIFIDNKIFGAAQVINKKDGTVFSVKDEILLTRFTDLASITLHKAWLHTQIVEKKTIEADLEIARSIQNKLLPASGLEQGTIKMNGFYKPAKNVGGDYYDYFPISSEEIFFAIGDVTGKGAQASILMASVKAFLAAALNTRNDLDEVVYMLNNFFYANSPYDKFITMFLGLINTTTGEIQYINAGHEPPFILRKGGDIEELKPTGMILGALDNIQYPTSKTVLLKDEKLFAYTDGITEARGPDQKLLGVSRLKELLTGINKEVLDYFTIIPEEITKFSGINEQSDDITFLLIEQSNQVKLL